MLAVVISEFMADNESTLADSDDEFSDWIEIRNSGPGTVELGGWYLTDDAADLTKWEFPDAQIAAGDQILVFASQKDRRVPGAELHTNFKLSKDGEYLAIVQADGLTVANSFDPEFPPQINDVSYGRSADGSVAGYFTSPTPGQPNTLGPVANPAQSVVISEIMYSLPRADILDAENIDEEFIELHNRGTASVDLSGWSFTRGVDFDFPNTSIPVGGYLVVAANVDSFAAKYPLVSNVVGGWTGKLSNSSETIELVDDRGNIINTVHYASEGDWSVRAVGPTDRGSNGWIWSAGHDGGNKSLELVNASLPNDFGQNWLSSTPDGGSPGQPNSNAEINSAPLINDVVHTPAIPRADDAVVVSARLLDESIGTAARLHWKVDTSSVFTSIDMVDDGQGPDPIAGDGVFAASIPAHADRTIIEFFVEAIDASSNSRTWPAPTASGAQSANALYQVIDEFDQDAPWNPENVPVYFQVMTTSERNEFTQTTRQSDAQYNATFIAIDGSGIDVRYNAGIRYRGSASRNDNVPPNRINLPNDRPWQGTTKLNMNPGNPVNNVAGAALFRLAGVEMADARGVQMFSNGVNLRNGLYAHVEVLDSDYTQVHDPEDSAGNIYRGRRPDESPPGGQGAGLAYFGPDPAPYVSYIKNTNASEADWSDVIHLTDVLNNSSSETYVEDVLQVVDVEQWFRAFAMNSLLGNNENGLFTGDNLGDDYAMYRGGVDTRFTMIPYDLDSLFVTGGFGGGRINGPLDEPAEVPALNRLINHPEFRRQFYAQYLDVIENVLLMDNAAETLWQSLRGVASTAQIEQILSFIQQRADYVLGQINQEVTVTADSPIVSGLPRTNSGSLTLSGEAPEASTVSMTVNGHLVENIDAERSWTFNVAGGQNVESDTLIAAGSVWKYLDDGSEQGTAWRVPSFNDTAWQQGPAQLGYGDGDEATVISDGPGQGNAATSYFRTTFNVADLSKADFLSIQLVYDDAAAVYINGTEVLRSDNLAPDADSATYASSTRSNQVENSFASFDVAADVLVSGENVIAVEVHQASANSSDVSFDLELAAIDVQTIDVEVPEELKLFPGINRYIVRTYDGSDATGNLVDEGSIDVWFNDGTTQTISGNITTNIVWSAENGPYLVTGNVTIDAGATLTVEPGTTVFFAENASLIVRGRIQAIGTPVHEIRFTREPGSADWNGIQFRDSMSDNRIEHAIIEYGVTGDGMVGLENSKLTLESVILDNTDRRRVRSIDSSLVVRNSTFTNIFEPGEQPTSDNQSEHIWGSGVPVNGQWILENNVFGHITGHNDSVDFDASRLPNPIPVIRNNVFMGGGDDALDMTGDVWIEGNTFQNFIKDQFNVDPGESNTISSSDGEYWVIGNTFRNVQHASLVKEEAFMHFLNNTVVDSAFAPLYFDLPGQTSGPGRGAIVENSILSDAPMTFDYVQPDTMLTVYHSFLTEDSRQYEGNGNLFGNPHVNADGSLGTGSFAIGAGTNGQDMGADVHLGATISGNPIGTTRLRNATIRVGGAAITHYRYQIDGGAYGQELPVETPIQLANLANGTHLLFVIGKNELGIWQELTDATTAVWTVDANYQPPVMISEILADNQTVELNGVILDLVELHNPSSSPVDLSNYSLTDDLTRPDRFVFPQNTVIGANQYLSLIADTVDGANNTLGFSLNAAGEGLYLFDASPTRQLVDSVEFGSQITDLSISRLGTDLQWGLSVPTLGAANEAHPVSDATSVVINEWYATGRIRITDDFIELYNKSEFPADIGNYFLSDKPFAIPNMSAIRPLSYIAADGFALFTADNGTGPEHVAFRISPELEQLGFFDPELNRIDVVFSPPQTSEYSMGRLPNGNTDFGFAAIPTPGATNGSINMVSVGFDWSAEWKYEASGTDLGPQWRDPEFDDAAWPSGAAALGLENEPIAVPIATEFQIGEPTYYFRRAFSFPDDIRIDDISATISTQVDDGFVVYLNGQEVVRIGMPNGPISFDTLANRNVNEARLEGPYGIPNGLFVDGENVLAVEVHQTALNSSDLVFALRLDATAEIAEGTSLPVLDRSLRISEIMYNPEGIAPTEYIELTNISDEPIDLTGVRLSGGIEFVFPAIILQPHQFVVVAEDEAAFANRYGRAVNLAGQYSGSLSNGGESIVLQFPAPFDAAILRFDYSDQWYPETDGPGRSLEIVDADLRFDRWSESEVWRASAAIGGSPGTDGTMGELPGDFNNDAIVDVQDIDLLCGGIRANAGDYDLDGNGAIDLGDLEYLVETILRSGIGDVNLDGIFNSQDLVVIFQAAEYEDGTSGNSTWADGDWNCDGDFTTRDIVYAFQKGAYSAASVANVDRLFAATMPNSSDAVIKSPDVRTKSKAAVSSGTKREIDIQPMPTDLLFAAPAHTSSLASLTTDLEVNDRFE